MSKLRFIFINIILILACTFVVKAEMVNMALSYDGKVHNYTAEPVYLVVNGSRLDNLSMPPVILDSNTLIPAREVFEPLGAVVDWNNDAREVYISYRNDLVILQIDNKYANVNGQKIEMRIPPKIINDKTMIPVRFAAEAIGLNVGWDNGSRVVSVSANGSADSLNAPPDTPQNNSSVTNIYSVTAPTEADSKFRIHADNPIGKLETFVLADNRLVIDVYNAQMTTGESVISVTHPFVTAVRMAQNQVEPEIITRVVFDLTTGTEAAVNLSEDKKSVVVSFEETTINNIDFYSDGADDYLRIEADAPITPNVYVMEEPKRLVIDIPLSKLNTIEKSFGRGRFVREVRYSQFEQSTVRVVLEADSEISYKTSANEKAFEIKVSEPTYRNINYNRENRQLVLNKAAGVDFSRLTQEEQLLNNRYIINLGADLEGLYGYGDIASGDNYFEAITLQTTAGNTQLIFNEKQILAYTTYEDENCLYISFMKPREKYSRIIVLDAGHGGKDQGATGNGLIEKDLTLDIIMKTKALLEQNGSFKVYTTRDTDVYPTLDERPAIANQVGDVFISVHINSSGTNLKANGTEVYYLKDGGNGLTSAILAETLQRNLVKELSSFDRKTKTADFKILRQSEIPSSLIEIGFISNYEEALKMSSDEYRQKAALAIYNSVVELFENYQTR